MKVNVDWNGFKKCMVSTLKYAVIAGVFGLIEGAINKKPEDSPSDYISLDFKKTKDEESEEKEIETE